MPGLCVRVDVAVAERTLQALCTVLLTSKRSKQQQGKKESIAYAHCTMHILHYGSLSVLVVCESAGQLHLVVGVDSRI